MADDEFVVEEEVKLTVAPRDQVEGTDVVGEALEDFGSYPSCPEGVASGDAVLDADVQLLNGAILVGVFLLRHEAPPGQCADSSQRGFSRQPFGFYGKVCETPLLKRVWGRCYNRNSVYMDLMEPSPVAQR